MSFQIILIAGEKVSCLASDGKPRTEPRPVHRLEKERTSYAHEAHDARQAVEMVNRDKVRSRLTCP